MPEADIEVGAKRGLDQEEFSGGANKMAKSDSMEVRLLLLGRNCGGIIGKGGENISRLRSNYSVQLRMPSTLTVDRAMTIQGTVENCIAVVREVLSHSTQVPYSTNAQCNIEVNLLVPTTHVGTIVGKGGARITEIREATQTKVKIYEECLPASNERVVAIGGDTEDQILVTITTILNILREIPNRSKPNYYEPEKSGGGGQRMPPLSSKKLPSNAAGGFPPNSLMSVGGGAGGGTGPQPLMGVGPPCSMGTNQANSVNTWLQLQTTTSITAPHEMCGAIIGKGGCRISEIRNGSGAQITFSEKDQKDDDRVITITGTQQQVQMAEQMITRFMSTFV